MPVSHYAIVVFNSKLNTGKTFLRFWAGVTGSGCVTRAGFFDYGNELSSA
jgi:hypothetical protein